jgi:hypothetical protein
VVSSALGWIFGLGFFVVLGSTAAASAVWRRVTSGGEDTKGPESLLDAGGMNAAASPTIVPLGLLPVTPGETRVYALYPKPAPVSGELMVVAGLDPRTVEGRIERCYEFRVSGAKGDPSWFWLFCHPFEDEPSRSFHQTLFRIPAADHVEFSVTLVDTESPLRGGHPGGMVGIVSRA